jgi:hypothetical protein
MAMYPESIMKEFPESREPLICHFLSFHQVGAVEKWHSTVGNILKIMVTMPKTPWR